MCIFERFETWVVTIEHESFQKCFSELNFAQLPFRGTTQMQKTKAILIRNLLTQHGIINYEQYYFILTCYELIFFNAQTFCNGHSWPSLFIFLSFQNNR